MPRSQLQRIAEYRSEAGYRRVLYCRRHPSGWSCRFNGDGLGRNSRPFFVVTAEGLSLYAALKVSAWGGNWSMQPGAIFPPISIRLGGYA